ncbi:phage tail assembly chaperone [Peptococcus simiae]|uniref:Phage tail assembly chaperone n=1 Tax=Peptococcus simiae TaxID=1643805 RepID=A0ABW9GYF2_9FIRM
METTLSEFLECVPELPENVKYVASERFKSPTTGEPLEWEIRPLSNAESERIKVQCQKEATKKGRLNQARFTKLYNDTVMVECTVFPDLRNGQLQDKFGVKSADPVELLGKMLCLPGEYNGYLEKVTEVNGFVVNQYEEAAEEAKND